MTTASSQWWASIQFTLLLIVVGLALMVAGLWLWPLMWVGGALLFATGIIPFAALSGPSRREADTVEVSSPQVDSRASRRSGRVD